MVALSVELAGAGELIPGLEVIGDGLVQQGALSMGAAPKVNRSLR
jgi:hypothetical protein